jgi:hypothetical protein
MGIHERDVRATGKPAVAVSAHDLPALSRCRVPIGPALVHGVTDVVVDRQDHGRVARDAPDGVCADHSVPLELTGELRLVVEEDLERGVDDDRVSRVGRTGSRR